MKKGINIWLITDTHFNHGAKLEAWGDRSGDWEKQIYQGLNEIPDEDVLIHLGDVCIGEDVFVHEFIEQMPCTKILIRGNHDGKSASWYMDHGWDFVCESLDLDFMGHKIHLSHKPANQHENQNFTLNIHGHTHGNKHRSDEHSDYYSSEYHLDICPEIVGYKPLRLDSILKKR